MKPEDYTSIKAKIEQYLGQFGEIYMPNDIKIKKDELLGLDEQKTYLNSFFKALNDYSKDSTFIEFPIPIIFSALLVGPPGTGKTTLAKAFAKEYKIPIIVVFSNALIGSLLGESLNRVKNLLRQAEMYARTKNPIILFFDEIDAISSERANKSDVGEIKRMVISFLQELDLVLEKKLPLGIIGATNHPNQLDKAVWRRFTFKIDFPPPSDEMRFQLIEHFLQKLRENDNFDVNINLNDDENKSGVLRASTSMTGADIERVFQIAVLRSYANRKDKHEKIEFSLKILMEAIKSISKINNKEDSSIDSESENKENYNFNADYDVLSGES
ncbi:MAG: ATP-binding protein [Candidatus Lokiarchaeota archaeon]|nr:ATP-binding protein [Candidatus Harpocratesius repetitus]